jgi:hypothetical protein
VASFPLTLLCLKPERLDPDAGVLLFHRSTLRGSGKALAVRTTPLCEVVDGQVATEQFLFVGHREGNVPRRDEIVNRPGPSG